MDFSLIQQADRTLSKCGGRPIIQGGAVVPIYKGFLMPLTLQPGQTQNFTKEITGDTIFELRSISSDNGMASVVGARIQIQLPSGRFLFGGNGMDVGQFAGVGSLRYLMDPVELAEPGSKIEVVLSDYTGLGSAIAVNLVFGGCYNYYLKGGSLSKGLSASMIPRYQGIVNENILAPCWMAGYGPITPPGYRDERYTYSSSKLTVPLAGPLTGSLRIPIDAGYESFVCRRFLFDVQQDATVTAGEFLGRIRSGNGYAVNEDYIDLQRYLGGAAYAHDWIVRGGDEVFIDLALADAAGSGNMYITAHLEGARRKRL